MKELFLYLNNTHKSRISVLAQVMLVSVILAFLAHRLFQSERFLNRADNIILLGLAGLIIYGTWIWILYVLQRRDRVNLKDMGITGRDILKGIWAGFYIFLSINLIFLAISLFTTQSVSLTESFSSLKLASQAVGIFIFNISARAFIEEAIFRAYLMPQLYLIIARYLNNKYTALALAVIVSQLIYALSHMPENMIRVNAAEQAVTYSFFQLFVGGIIHAVVYLRTRNLLFVTVVHAFINFSLAVIETPNSFRLFALLVTILITIFWNKLFPAHTVASPGNSLKGFSSRKPAH